MDTKITRNFQYPIEAGAAKRRGRHLFPKARAPALQSRYQLINQDYDVQASTEQALGAEYLTQPWSADALKAAYPQAKHKYAAATIPDEPEGKSQPYLYPFLTRNERLRLTTIWYYTRDMLQDVDLIARLQDKVQLARDLTGWEYAIIGIVDNNYFSRLAAVNMPLSAVHRRDSPCSHTINQEAGHVFFLPDMSHDWRFCKSPPVEAGGLRAYAGIPLCLDLDSGENIAIGSLCVASTAKRDVLTHAQQRMLVHIAESVIVDIVHSARERRELDRSNMMDLLKNLDSGLNTDEIDQGILAAVRQIYPDALVDMQSSADSRITVDGQEAVDFSAFKDGQWEDGTLFEDYVRMANNETPMASKTVRMIAAVVNGPSTPTFLVVATRDLRLILDDIDSWFVQACADMASKHWHMRHLKEAASFRESFLRGITHQLRTPIHGILGSVDLLAEELSSLDTTIGASSSPGSTFTDAATDESSTQMHLDAIKASGQDLIATVNSLITLSDHTDQTNVKRRDAPCSIDEIETALADELWRVITGNIRYDTLVFFKRELSANCDIVQIDKALLISCLLPIIINALQHTSNGAIIITISTFCSSDRVVFDIEDSGCGIDPERARLLFNSAKQTDSQSLRAGLGLLIASRLAAVLGGSMSLVNTEEETGSHFRLSLRGGILACSYPPAKLVPGNLINLRRTFHILGPAESKDNRLEHFAQMLEKRGLQRTQSSNGVLLIADENDASVNPSLYPEQVLIRLTSVLTQQPSGIGLGTNVVVARSPYTTSNLTELLQQVDTLYDVLGSTTTKDDGTCMRRDSHSASIADQPSQNLLCSTAHNARGPPTEIATTKPTTPSLISQHALRVKRASSAPEAYPWKQIELPIALLVDDNSINLKFLEMYCKKRNMPYNSAGNGQEAVDIYAKQERLPARIIFMDLQMPICDGVEATRQIRQLESANKWASSVIFMISGQDSSCDKKRAMEAGANEYLIKPAGVDILDHYVSAYFTAAAASTAACSA